MTDYSDVERRLQNEGLLVSREVVNAIRDERDAALARVERLEGVLRQAWESEGGISYGSDDDGIGVHACCMRLTYAPHAEDCWMTMAQVILAEGGKPPRCMVCGSPAGHSGLPCPKMKVTAGDKP